MNAHMPPPDYATPEPPNNIEAEQALIGAVLMNNDVFSLVQPVVSKDAFFEPLHQQIWDVATGLINQRKVASPITMKAFLADADLGGLTVGQYLARLASHATSPLAAPSFAEQIADLAARRRLIDTGRDLIAGAFDVRTGATAAHIAGQGISALMEATETVAKQTRRMIGESAAGVIERARKIMEGVEKPRTVTTGIYDIDMATGGYRPGELWLVAGRPGMGKSNFAISSSRRAAKSGSGVMMFELELPEEQLTARYLAESAYAPRRAVTFGQIMRGQLDAEELWLVEDAKTRLEALPLVLDVAPSLTVDDISARVRAEKARMARSGLELGVVFIDQLDFVKPSSAYRGQRVHEIGEVSRGLKSMAKEEGVCVVLFVQLNRGVESRDDKRPGLSDLRDSGNLEQDADVVAFLYREAYYIERSPEFRRSEEEAIARAEEVRNRLEFILGKNRTGPVRTFELFCDIGSSVIAAGARGGRS